MTVGLCSTEKTRMVHTQTYPGSSCGNQGYNSYQGANRITWPPEQTSVMDRLVKNRGKKAEAYTGLPCLMTEPLLPEPEVPKSET